MKNGILSHRKVLEIAVSNIIKIFIIIIKKIIINLRNLCDLFSNMKVACISYKNVYIFLIIISTVFLPISTVMDGICNLKCIFSAKMKLFYNLICLFEDYFLLVILLFLNQLNHERGFLIYKYKRMSVIFLKCGAH